MDREIKEAIEKRLEEANYPPELKDRALNYAIAKTKKKIMYPIRLKQFSLITVCTVTLVLSSVYYYFSIAAPSPERQSLSEVNPLTTHRIMTNPLTETFRELEIEHQEQAILLEDDNMMISYMIEGSPGYEIEFTSFLYQIEVCDEVKKILSDHGVDNQRFRIVKLSENRVFVYYDIPEVLLDYLNGDETLISCSLVN